MSETFDPSAPEGDVRVGSQYMSKKDLKTILVILVVLGIALIPVYKMLEKNSEKARCVTNLQAIAGAINIYAEQYEGRFPPAFAVDPANQGPLLIDKSKSMAYSWATAISPFMKARASLTCPSATPEENLLVWSHRPVDQNNLEDKSRKFGQEFSSYGMYLAYSGFPVDQVADPNQTVIIAESSNMGARGSLDPVKYMDEHGNPIPFDGIGLGWDNSNTAPNRDTKSITRLAFYANGDARHGQTIHALTASGALINLDQTTSVLINREGVIHGCWSVPASLGR